MSGAPANENRMEPNEDVANPPQQVQMTYMEGPMVMVSMFAVPESLPMQQYLQYHHLQYQQFLQRYAQQWPYGQQPQVMPQAQLGHPQPLNGAPPQFNHESEQQFQQQIQQNVMVEQQEQAQQPQPIVSSHQMSWNVNAAEFFPVPKSTETPTGTADVTETEPDTGIYTMDESSVMEPNFTTETKMTSSPPPTELEELFKEASPEKQAVISLQGDAPADESSETAKTGIETERISHPEKSSSDDVEDVVTEFSALKSTDDAKPVASHPAEKYQVSPEKEIATTSSTEVLGDLTSSVEQEPAESSEPLEEQGTSSEQQPVGQVATSKSQQKKLKKEKQQKEAAEKLAREQLRQKQDDEALAEAVAANSARNITKAEIREAVKKYQQSEKLRRRQFQLNGSKLPNDTKVNWIAMDLYMYWKSFRNTSKKTPLANFFDQMVSTWADMSGDAAAEANQFWVPFFEVLKEEQDAVVHHDMAYLSNICTKFPSYAGFLQNHFVENIFDENGLRDAYPPVFLAPESLNRKLYQYLHKHTIRRYTNKKSLDKMEPLEIATVVAFKKNPWSGMSMSEANLLIQQKVLLYRTHPDQNPDVIRLAKFFELLSTVPSPVLAFDASFCLELRIDVQSDLVYANIVVGNEEEPPAVIEE